MTEPDKKIELDKLVEEEFSSISKSLKGFSCGKDSKFQKSVRYKRPNYKFYSKEALDGFPFLHDGIESVRWESYTVHYFLRKEYECHLKGSILNMLSSIEEKFGANKSYCWDALGDKFYAEAKSHFAKWSDNEWPVTNHVESKVLLEISDFCYKKSKKYSNFFQRAVSVIFGNNRSNLIKASEKKGKSAELNELSTLIDLRCSEPDLTYAEHESLIKNRRYSRISYSDEPDIPGGSYPFC